MSKYKLLIIVYFVSVISSPIANFIGIDVQNLYRLPFLDIRWIDLVIIMVIIGYYINIILKRSKVYYNNCLVILCSIYLLFESVQISRTWGHTDTGWQIAGLICTLNFFILIDLLTFKLNSLEIIKLLNFIILFGSISLIITNFYLFYSFVNGNIVIQDLDIRVGIDVIGAKETVSTVTLMPLVFIGNLYYIQKPGSIKIKLIHLLSLLGIFISLILTFHRGTLLTISLLSIIYIFYFSNKPSQVLSKVSGLMIVFFLLYFFFGSILQEKGYDPLNKVKEIIAFTMDFENPSWDKGRAIPNEYALEGWRNNIYTGVGYIDMHHFGLPEEMGAVHNFILASLFYRGVIGTLIYLFILLLLFRNSFRLWRQVKNDEDVQNDVVKLLIISSFFWLIPFWTQDIIWEKYSLSIQFLYLGIITNLYKQKVVA